MIYVIYLIPNILGVNRTHRRPSLYVDCKRKYFSQKTVSGTCTYMADVCN